MILLTARVVLARDDIPTTGSVRSADASSDLRATNLISTTIYFPLAGKEIPPGGCPSIPSETYNTVAIISAPTNPPAEIHADLNLAMRGYITTTATLGLVDIGGGSDAFAPQLYGLFQDNRTPVFSSVSRVYDWDWACNCRGALLTNWDVTLAGMTTTPDEIIRVPSSGYDIGRLKVPLGLPGGFEVMVLYATPNRLTLKYTREDNVIQGYTLHLENICVEPRLLNLYYSMNNAGRVNLPALYVGQGVGRAIGKEIGVAIRDNGMFMDPRSRKDWWIGR
jgi:hypothetical protein